MISTHDRWCTSNNGIKAKGRGCKDYQQNVQETSLLIQWPRRREKAHSPHLQGSQEGSKENQCNAQRRLTRTMSSQSGIIRFLRREEKCSPIGCSELKKRRSRNSVYRRNVENYKMVPHPSWAVRGVRVVLDSAERIRCLGPSNGVIISGLCFWRVGYKWIPLTRTARVPD